MNKPIKPAKNKYSVAVSLTDTGPELPELPE